MLSMTNFQPSGIRPVFRESNDPSNGRKLTVRKPTLAGTRPWLIGSEYDAWPLAPLRQADLAR